MNSNIFRRIDRHIDRQIDQRTWAIAFACFSMFVLGMSDNIRGPLFPELLTHFKLTNAQGSVSFAVSSAAALFGNIMAGYLLKKITLSRLLCISVFLMGFGLLIMGISPTYFVFLAGSIVFGASMGLVALAQNVLVAESAAGKSQSKALAGLHGIYGLSSLLAPMVASYAAILMGFWQAAFLVAATTALAVATLATVAKSEPAFKVHSPDPELKNNKISKSALLVYGGVLAFYVVAEILVSSRLALYMRTYFKMDLKESSWYVTSFFICLLLGRILFALKAFKAKLRTQLNISLVAAIVCLSLGLTIHPFFLVVLGFAMAPFYPMSVAYISEQSGIFQRQFIAFAMSFQSFCVIAMHLGVGYLTDRFGLFYAFEVGLISLVLSLVCVNLHPKISKT